jgi:uncharacterized protein YbaP (TraB family)
MTLRASIACSIAALLVLAHAACFAQGSPARFDRGLLWKIEKSGRPPSFLFGTVHIPDPRLLDFSPAVLGALKSAEQVATEIAMDMSNLQQLMVAMVYTDGRTLEGVAGKKLYAEVAAIMVKIGVPEILTMQLKPWAAMTMLIVPPRGDAIPMDMALYQAAGQAGKKQAALESIDEQVALFEDQSVEHQLIMLRDVVANYDKVGAATQKMLRSYLDRDLGALNALAANEDLLSSKEARALNRSLMNRMIGRRNVVMADRMEPLLERSSTFVAVGALHLPGANGLLMLLERRGYRVSRADE